MLAALLILLAFPMNAFATTAATLSLSVSSATAGASITASGISDAGEWVSVKILDSTGSVIYYDAVKADVNGNYSETFTVPAVSVGTLTVIAGSGTNVASKTLTITAAETGGSTGGKTSGGTGSGSSTTPATTPATTTPASDAKTAVASTTMSTTTDSTGRATGAVTADQIAKAASQAISDAAAAGSTTKPVVEIKVEADKTATAVETSIPKAAITDLAGGKTDSVIVSSPVADITFDRATLEGLAATAGTEDIKITAEKVETSTLSAAASAQVGEHPVFDFSVMNGDTAVSNFGGSVTVSVPYTLAAGESASSVIIYYVKADGTLETVKNCVYDTATGTVLFKTTHFSKYAVAYNSVSFGDVSGWYADSVSYLAARGIINGKSSSSFAPQANITRAEFVQILAGMSGADLNSFSKTSFSDVKTGDWYAEAVEWAYESGIASGYNGNFAPNTCITRQDMAVMLTRYADKVAKFTLPTEKTAVTFSDTARIASYAASAVTAMQQAGVISGKGNNLFDPTANATRAESAKMVTVLLQSMLG